jgi:3-methyladenine DNA glycosylase AlkD
VSTYAFIREADVEDTFRIAEMLFSHEHGLVQKATGSCLGEAGKKDLERLLRFPEKLAAIVPCTTLWKAIEKLHAAARARFRAVKAAR